MEENDKKISWPELVGANVDVAVETITKENPQVNVQKVPSDRMVTCDYRLDRVRVFYDADTNVVSRVPKIG